MEARNNCIFTLNLDSMVDTNGESLNIFLSVCFMRLDPDMPDILENLIVERA